MKKNYVKPAMQVTTYGQELLQTASNFVERVSSNADLGSEISAGSGTARSRGNSVWGNGGDEDF